MALLAELWNHATNCEGCRNRRATLMRILSSWLGRRSPSRDPGEPDFRNYFLFIEHVDERHGTVTFRLNDRHDDGYRLGMKIPVDWQNQPVSAATLIDAMTAQAIPAIRRDLAGPTPPDFRRLTPLQGQRVDISEAIKRHYHCEDCKYA